MTNIKLNKWQSEGQFCKTTSHFRNKSPWEKRQVMLLLQKGAVINYKQNMIKFSNIFKIAGIAVLIAGATVTLPLSAFKSVETSSVQSVGWFATDRDGNLVQPYQQVDQESLCQGGEAFCAKEYNIVDGNPDTATGNSAMRP